MKSETGLDHHLADLVRVMTMNRQQYGRPWRKLRYDRVAKLLPELQEEEVFLVLRQGVQTGVLETCTMLSDGEERVGVKLKNYRYVPRRYRSHR